MQQKKQTNYLLLALSIPFLFALVASGAFIGCNDKETPINCQYEGQECPNYYKGCTGHLKPVSVDYFKDGQILLPDYACPDTLIVIDAESLNANFAYYEQKKDWGSDADIDSLLHCPNAQGLPGCMNFYQYVEFKIGEGYSAEIASHLALVDFGRMKADSLYKAIKED